MFKCEVTIIFSRSFRWKIEFPLTFCEVQCGAKSFWPWNKFWFVTPNDVIYIRSTGLEAIIRQKSHVLQNNDDCWCLIIACWTVQQLIYKWLLLHRTFVHDVLRYDINSLCIAINRYIVTPLVHVSIKFQKLWKLMCCSGILNTNLRQQETMYPSVDTLVCRKNFLQITTATHTKFINNSWIWRIRKQSLSMDIRNLGSLLVIKQDRIYCPLLTFSLLLGKIPHSR